MVAGARFLRAILPLLRAPVDSSQAKTALDRRLRGRADAFLELVRQAVYGHADSPYRALLNLAGCEYGDLERLVRHDGVEGTLATLLRHGVYLTVEEFKGRRLARRGSTEIEVTPRGLRNPGSTAHLEATTSGSRGSPTPVPVDAMYLKVWAENLRLQLEARGGLAWSKAYWAVPGAASIAWLVCYAAGGIPLARWFSPIEPKSSQLPALQRAGIGLVPWAGRVAGGRLPRAEHASPAEPRPIVQWMTKTLRSGGIPYLVGYASALVRLCQTARDLGADLTGARALAVGEPMTDARLRVFRDARVRATVSYGSVDVGPFGYSCLTPESADDVHLFQDLFALVQREPTNTAGLRPRSLLATTLCQAAPLVLLNVSIGDDAVRTDRACGCPLERLGWTTHLHTIRSYEKLTAGGMTFLDSDLIWVLEELLPARFGGSAVDYQLVEQENAEGSSIVRLLVHPRVGAVDTRAVIDTFLEAVGARSPADRMMGLVWREAKLLVLERRPPLATSSGKILHLHVERR